MAGDLDQFDLACAHPPQEILPSSADILTWASVFVNNTGPDLVGYGEHAGSGEARISIASWLANVYSACRWEPSGLELLLCAGVSGGLDLAARRLDTWYLDDSASMGQVVLVEEQTYELALPIFEAAGLQIVRVPSDGDGIDVDAVASEVRARGGAGAGSGGVRFLYVVPTHGNPTGATLCPERRARISELSQKLRFYVVADEVYSLLSFDDSMHQPLSAFGGAIVSVFSVSKFLSPGLRVGWMHSVNRAVRERLSEVPVVFSGGSPVPALVAAAVAGAADTGELQRRVEVACKLLGDRCKALTEELTAGLRDVRGAKLWPCRGGYFVWLELGSEAEAAEVAQQLSEASPAVKVGVLQGARGLRLCFAGHNSSELRMAAGVIVHVAKRTCGT